ncbi:MAG: hypothetical protein ABSF95_13085 [Verrucomicrobiota bacterium]|jgi:hypothetical protein
MKSNTIPARRWIRSVAALGLVLSLGLACAGCKKSDNQGAVDAKAFQAAAPEIKAAWDRALAAAQSNDYAAAYLTLRQLRAQSDLTPGQLEAINAQSTLVNDRMAAAAQKGDTNALQAIQEIRKASRMPGR